MPAGSHVALPVSLRHTGVCPGAGPRLGGGETRPLMNPEVVPRFSTMPPLPHAYQGRDAIGTFLRGSAERRGAPLRLVPTRANTQPAFGCYLGDSATEIARAYAFFVLTLAGDQISAITWFADSSVLAQFGLPPTLRYRQAIRPTSPVARD
jgi:hypothetical protein